MRILKEKKSKEIKKVERTYTVHEAPPVYNGTINLCTGIDRNPNGRYASEEWLALWESSGWTAWTLNGSLEEDGLLLPFIYKTA